MTISKILTILVMTIIKYNWTVLRYLNLDIVMTLVAVVMRMMTIITVLVMMILMIITVMVMLVMMAMLTSLGMVKLSRVR